MRKGGRHRRRGFPNPIGPPSCRLRFTSRGDAGTAAWPAPLLPRSGAASSSHSWSGQSAPVPQHTHAAVRGPCCPVPRLPYTQTHNVHPFYAHARSPNLSSDTTRKVKPFRDLLFFSCFRSRQVENASFHCRASWWGRISLRRFCRLFFEAFSSRPSGNHALAQVPPV